MTDLERSHTELRAALILAGKEIRRLNYGRRDSLLLRKLRVVLRDARVVVRAGLSREARGRSRDPALLFS